MRPAENQADATAIMRAVMSGFEIKDYSLFK
jgi:hypothetical protein